VRAAILTEIPSTELLVADDVDLRPLEPGDVKIDIAHSGVCHSDLSTMNGTIPGDPPMVLGHEGSGVVRDVGDGVTHVEPGDHVIVAFSPPCGTCAYCNERAQANLCINGTFTMLGNTQFVRGGSPVGSMTGCGTFAEQTIVPGMAAIKIDEDIPLDVAALVGCGVTTGVGAVHNTAGVEPGSTVAVVGCGGVGLACINGAAIAGAGRIIAVDMISSKLELAKTFGATDLVSAADGDPVEQIRELTAGGVDYSFEAIGLKATAEQCFRMLGRGGTATIIGMIPVGTMVEVHGVDFLAEKKLQGCTMGSNRFRVDMPRYVDFYLNGTLKLDEMISARLPLDRVNEAFESMRKGTAARSVIVFD